jgi:hypothetical protein
MRVPVLVYALLYLVFELIGAQLAAVDWARITPLMVASAVTDALVVVAVLVAVLVAADLSKHRWRPLVHSWLHAYAQPHSGWWGAHRPHHHHGHEHLDGAPVVGVPSWRRERLALPMGSPSAAPTARYAAPTYAVSGSPAPPARPFPEDDDRML